MSITYLEVIPKDILNLILLEIDDVDTFAKLFRTYITPIENHLRSEIFWKSKIKILFPQGGYKYINSYLMSFKGSDDVIIMKYSILYKISKNIDDILFVTMEQIESDKGTEYMNPKYRLCYFSLAFINNYDCLKLDSLYPYDRDNIIYQITRDGAGRVIAQSNIIPQIPYGYEIIIENITYRVTSEDIRNILGHLISNGHEIDV